MSQPVSGNDDWPASWGPPPAAGWSPAVTGRIAGLGAAVMVLLALGVLVDLAGILVSLQQLDLVDRIAGGVDLVTDAEIDRSDQRSAAVGVTQLGQALATGVVFVVWLWRAYTHADRRAAWPMRHSRGWVIGGWLVPFLNLIRPKQIVDDVWRGSRVDRTQQPAVPWYVHVWWLAFVAALILGRIYARYPADTVEQVRAATQIGIASDVARLTAGVLGVALVRRLTRNQRAWLAGDRAT